MPLDFPILLDDQLAKLSDPELRDYILLLEELTARTRRNRFFEFYPDEGPLRRELYQKHLAFFRAGAEYKERLALCANRVGKTEGMGGYEMTAHLTGRYPHWWDGYRFGKPIRAMMAGKTNETTRDILQAKMLGDTQHLPNGRKRVDGTGMVPGDDIGAIVWKRGSDLIDRAAIAHHDRAGAFDGWSRLAVKSYEQGRGAFEGTEQDLIWPDEEPPLDIYTEMLTRTMTTRGLIMITFTPLEGMSEVVLSFLPNGDIPQDYIDEVIDYGNTADDFNEQRSHDAD